MLACLLLASSLVASPDIWDFSLSGQNRRAIVYAPLEARAGKRKALLMLHGGAGSADQVAQTTGFHKLGDRDGIVVCYPEGTEYNAGRHAWSTGYLLRDQLRDVDDVAFLDAVIDRLIQKAGVDPRHVYMTGSSNGAMMTFVYAQRRSNRLAGIAPVVGAMFSYTPAPSSPAPLLMVNAELDDEVPLEGGWSRNPLVRVNQAAPYKPYAETLAQWASWNVCEPTPTVRQDEVVIETSYRARPGGRPVVGLVLKGAEHGWPGVPSGRGGPPTTTWQGTSEIWRWMQGLSVQPGAGPAREVRR